MRKRFEGIDFVDVALWIIRAGILLLVIWGTIAALIDNPYSRTQWLDFIIFGFAQGSMYALIAIGYTLVYGVLFMINFAHGEFFIFTINHQLKLAATREWVDAALAEQADRVEIRAGREPVLLRDAAGHAKLTTRQTLSTDGGQFLFGGRKGAGWPFWSCRGLRFRRRLGGCARF